jgi:hypothetical protein
MLHFIGIAIRLLIGMVLVCQAIILTGRILPARSTLGLGACDGQPCLQGIIPGKTAWLDAQRILSEQALARVADKSIRLLSTNHAQADLFISVDLTNVGRIAITPSGTITLGWLIAQYGVPCGITIYRYSRMITIRYPSLLANIEPDVQELAWGFPLKQVQILDPAFRPVFQRDMCVDNLTDGARNYLWGGFTTAHYYYRHMHLWQD